ncbi:pre-mRNA cleavage factor Im 25 kDa subunit 1 isoform X2 [Elaeis guineensis]|uniref:Pre-mRNA cleavage factor Im 25 kDa subunit n=1 Tax=Elaeis guineensis var. tenera TaxID=51953 RepID=A0A6I9RLK4_ELAGV|nr:pre-mRNA cleavage factor Im 25 kDa subunit 1 [Elaeis guineensis]
MEDGEHNDNGGGSGHNVVDIYPLSRYYFSSKDAIPEKDDSLADRIQRLKASYAAHGLRTCVEGVLLVELFQHPHVLLLQVKNSFFKLPGGRLRPGESDIEGLKRKLSRKLSLDESCVNDEWQVDECIGIWWRSEFETLPFPYLPPNTHRPKECAKLFLVRLPRNRQFVVPKNLKLLAVPLCQIHDNSKTYGPIISGIPHLLSKFYFNTIHD